MPPTDPILFYTDLGVTAIFCNSVAPAVDLSLSTSMTFSSSSIPTVGLATIQKGIAVAQW